MTKIFVEILAVAHEMNILKLGKVSIDGTKVHANASKHKALSYGHACKLEKQLEAEVAELLKKAESVDKDDIPDGMDIPAELSIRQKRVKAIKEAKAEIERRAAERHAQEKRNMRTKSQREPIMNKKPVKRLEVKHLNPQQPVQRKKTRLT